MARHSYLFVLAQVAEVIEMAGLRIGATRADVGRAASLKISNVMSSTEELAISWMKLTFLYSPDAIRETTSAG